MRRGGLFLFSITLVPLVTFIISPYIYWLFFNTDALEKSLPISKDGILMPTSIATSLLILHAFPQPCLLLSLLFITIYTSAFVFKNVLVVYF